MILPQFSGKLTQQMGGFVEVATSSGAALVFQEIRLTEDDSAKWQVVHRGGGGVYLCAELNASPAAIPAEVSATGSFTFEPLSKATILSLCQFSAGRVKQNASPHLIETGIKGIDLLCPMISGGLTAFIGGPGQGRVVLVEELFHRLAYQSVGQRLLFLIDPAVAIGVPEVIAQHPSFPSDEAGGLRTYWAITTRASEADFLADQGACTTRFVFSAEYAAREYYPALDLLASRTTGFGDLAVYRPEHVAMAERVREALHYAIQPGAAQNLERVRGQKLRTYFTQPFSAETTEWKLKGAFVTLAETIEDCRAILAGQVDDVAENTLRLIGRLAEARTAE